MNKFIVLLFHSVDKRNLSSLKNLGNIHPDLFEQCLLALSKYFVIVGLEDIIACINGADARKGTLIAITFDDGTKSYITDAVPVMEKLNIPSTCFLITEFTSDSSIYWRYLYNYCINRGHGRSLADLISAEYEESITKEEIISFSRRNFTEEKNRNIVSNILKKIVSESEYRQTEKDLFLSSEDIEFLKKNPLVTFGIHTSTHPLMMNLSDDEIYKEISESLEFFKRNVKDDIPMFSVPFGRLYKDYDERTISIAHSLSIKHIFSAYGGSNEKGQPLYNVRRVPVNQEMLSNGIDSFVKMLHEPYVAPEYVEKEKRLADALKDSKK
jgi:peptidoglycan/xylan/chitin deacetylase (PgdA/CDA1 family)